MSMKIRQEKILFPAQSAFKAVKYSVPFFDMSYHFHPEYELVYITSGSGTRYIGNTAQKFSSGDMVFIGPGLAHIWINPMKYHQENSTLKVEAIVLQFSPELISPLLAAPEFNLVRELLDEARYGLKIVKDTHRKVVKLLEELLAEKGVRRFVKLLGILDVLSRDRDAIRLNQGELPRLKGRQDVRVDAVQHFIMSCFTQNISSRDAAALANMEHSAFCRFFKGKTGKTFTRYLNETRIDQACQLLLKRQQSVTQIAFECGYGNLAHFYKQFKTIMGMTPGSFLRD